MDRIPNNLSRDTSSVEGILRNLRQICTRFQLVSLNRPLEAAENLLGRNPPIDVAILGQFKAGEKFLYQQSDRSIHPSRGRHSGHYSNHAFAVRGEGAGCGAPF